MMNMSSPQVESRNVAKSCAHPGPLCSKSASVARVHTVRTSDMQAVLTCGMEIVKPLQTVQQKAVCGIVCGTYLRSGRCFCCCPCLETAANGAFSFGTSKSASEGKARLIIVFFRLLLTVLCTLLCSQGWCWWLLLRCVCGVWCGCVGMTGEAAWTRFTI